MGQVSSPAESTDNLVLYAGDTALVNVNSLLTEAYKPDNRSTLVEKFGPEAIGGIYGLCHLTGAIEYNSADNDVVTYWEAKRLHKRLDGTIASTTAGTTAAKVITSAGHTAIVQDKVKIDGRFTATVTAVTTNTFTVYPDNPWPVGYSANAAVSVVKVGSEFAQGTNQPDKGVVGNYDKLTNPFIIHKQMVPFTGTELTNGTWININGKDAFFSQELVRQELRWMNECEALYIHSEKITNADLISANPGITGSEGVFEAIKKRGINKSGAIQDKQDLRQIIKAMKKQNSSISQLSGFFDVDQMFAFNDMAASAAGSNGQPSFGMFNNDKDMALKLDFKSVEEGGVTLHAHEWQMMVDPQWFGNDTSFERGVIVPFGKVAQPKGGAKSSLEINYRGKNGYTRKNESWITGAADGVYNHSEGYDGKLFNRRKEANIILRGANSSVRLTA
jgi:hypothetical protein